MAAHIFNIAELILANNYLQKGTPRSKEEVLSELEAQIQWAYTKATSTWIDEMQTNSGVKDAFTQYWIDELIKQYKAKIFEAPDRPKSEITAELKEFVDKHLHEIYNSFLTLQGDDLFCISCLRFFSQNRYRL